MHRNFIAGEWIDGVDAAENINPSDTRDVVGLYARASAQQAEVAIAAAQAALPRMAATTPQQRADALDAVGSEIECHPAFGNADLQTYSRSKRAFARHARRYFHQPDLLYRHIVPSAFTSAMGPGLISGERAAAWAWFLIKRGYRYVPVSYTGIAMINYLKFAFRIHASPDPDPSLRRVAA